MPAFRKSRFHFERNGLDDDAHKASHLRHEPAAQRVCTVLVEIAKQNDLDQSTAKGMRSSRQALTDQPSVL